MAQGFRFPMEKKVEPPTLENQIENMDNGMETGCT